MSKEKTQFKVGSVAIVGRPNVGKSTLLNALLHHKVAIVSAKPQTTRSQIMAYFEDERGQIFFLDTPGYYTKRTGGVQIHNKVSRSSIGEADVVLFVVDQTRHWGREDELVWNMLQVVDKPVIMIINKSDSEYDYSQDYIDLLGPDVTSYLRTSAKNHVHILGVINEIFQYLPKGKRDTTVDNFPTPLLSQGGTEFLEELIREKLYWYLKKEMPYTVAVRVYDLQEYEEENRMHVKAELLVQEPRHKAIVIGEKGRMITKIKDSFKKELELVTGRDIHATLKVKLKGKSN